MNLEERRIFGETLCSFSGNDYAKEREKLLSVIKYPKLLFRYRPVTFKSLDALRTNRLYFSSSDYYDDPFDTFLNIDIDKLKKEYYSAFEKTEDIDVIFDQVCVLLGNIYSKEQIKQIVPRDNKSKLFKLLSDNFIKSALLLRDAIQKETWSICFSENGFNESLWLKYADRHKGFALIYDVETKFKYLCNSGDYKKDCGKKECNMPLYPVYYSNKPYDATEFSKYVMLKEIMKIVKTKTMPEYFKAMGTFTWEQEKVALIKKECHKYDEEWRILSSCINSSPFGIEWIPKGIILGLRMDNIEQNLVIEMAKKAGIK